MSTVNVRITSGTIWTNNLLGQTTFHRWALAAPNFGSVGSVGENGVATPGQCTLHTSVNFGPGGSAGSGTSIVHGTEYDNAVYGTEIVFDTVLGHAKGKISLQAWASEQAFSNGDAPLFTAEFNGTAKAFIDANGNIRYDIC